MLNYLFTEINYAGRPFQVAALFRDGNAEQLMVEPAGIHSRVGYVMRGVTDRVAKEIGGVFVRAGKEKMFLPKRRSSLTGEFIDAGRPLLFQIQKDPSGSKEAVVTDNISVAGKYAVVFHKPGPPAFSSRLTEERKELLTKWLGNTDHTSHQIIVRTNAAGCEKQELLSEIAGLNEELKRIQDAFKTASSGKLLYRPEPFYVTLLRDLREKPDRCITDITAAAGELTKVNGSCELRDRVGDGLTLSEEYGLPQLLDKLTQKVVRLKNGAFLVIERTEAFVTIDVNSGKCTRSRIPEETYRTVNRAAAEEIIRQIRLRNLSGIILIDFLKEERTEHKEELVNVMKKLARRERVRCEVIDLTPLGIMEIVRQKQQKPLAEVLFM